MKSGAGAAGARGLETGLVRGLAGASGIILVCFFLSGATGLVYQVIWLRLLGLVFGHTVYAITTVLAAFMAGLALGSFVFARRAAAMRDLVGAYGWLEIGVGVSCALIPALLGAAERIYVMLHRGLGLSYDALGATQFLVVFTLLVIPTTLMGGTLPVLSQALVKGDIGLGRKVGTLYAVNTFGAVVGVALAGYVLLPAWGIRLTVAAAAVANLAVGVTAIALGRRLGGGDSTSADDRGPAPAAGHREARAQQHSAEAGRTGAVATVVALGISGAVSMVYEVAWTRALTLVIGSSTYAFTSMLLAFLIGIAGGSALYSWLLGARPVSAAAFGALQAGIGVVAALLVLAFERMPELFLVGLRWSTSPSFVELVQFAVSASVLLPLTLLIGATFPCAVAVAARGADRIGRHVGHVYAVNSVGAIAGAIAGGFLLIPALGIHSALKVGIGVNLVLAAVLLVVTGRIRAWHWVTAAALIAAVGAVVLIPRWDPRVMSSGPAIYGQSYLHTATRASLAEALRSQRLLYYKDGVSGTVSVDQTGEHVFLRVNGKMDAGTAVDMPTQMMLGHLPLLLHEGPRAVLVIGLGSGISAGAVARHPVDRIDVAEIEPAVVEASRFFSHVNGKVLEDPRARVVIADARNLLLTTSEQYDVIVSEPSNPWIGGIASLFSTEFFRLAREHLRPGGIMAQWVHGYNLAPEDIRTIVATFRTAFPSTTIWNTIPGDFVLVGRRDPAAVDLDRLRRRYEENPGVWKDLGRIGVNAWGGVLGYFMLDEAGAARYAEGARLNTDDALPLEFSAPRSLYRDTTLANWRLMRSFRTAELPAVTPESRPELDRADVRHAIALGYLNRSVPGDALTHFDRALAIDPGRSDSRLGAAVCHYRLGRPAVALDLARQLLTREPQNADALFVAGLASDALASTAEAIGFLERAVELRPQNRDFRSALARVTARANALPSTPGGSK